MPRRDLIRNVIIVGVLVLALILLRIFVFHPFSINDKMANASVKNGDLVVATRNAQVDRSDLVLYKVGGKEYLGRVIAKENDEVSYVDDVLYLKDTGLGIKDSDILRVFERGFSGYNGRLTQQSSGLGLYLSKKIADQLGHDISISSQVGQGTTVSIHFQKQKLAID